MAKKSDKIGWAIGALTLGNLFLIAWDSGEGNIGQAEIKPSLIVGSIAAWSASFVPGLKYVSLMIMIPVFFLTFMTKGIRFLDAFVNGELFVQAKPRFVDKNAGKTGLGRFDDDFTGIGA